MTAPFGIREILRIEAALWENLFGSRCVVAAAAAAAVALTVNQVRRTACYPSLCVCAPIDDIYIYISLSISVAGSRRGRQQPVVVSITRLTAKQARRVSWPAQLLLGF